MRQVSINKRTFLRMMAAAPAAACARTWAAVKGPLINWAGNLIYSTDRLEDAASLEAVQRSIHAHERMKVLGTRHCFNNIADSRDFFLSVRSMHDILSLDETARTVTVGGGITYGQLGPLLESKGWALHNLASLPHISVAGAASTGTHGSGEHNGNLSTAVVALEIVNAAGDVVNVSRANDRALFHGAVVGLGALGAITKVTLAIEPTYQVKQYVYENLPMRRLREHFDEIQAAGYSVSLFTDWQKSRVNEVWIKSRLGAGHREFSAPQEFFGATLATKNLHPIAEITPENCTEQMGVPGSWFERLPHFKVGFTPSAGKELQTEYFVPRAQALDAIFAIERLRDHISPHLLISEIRTIAADDLWLSPCYKRDSVTLHFTWKQDWPAVEKVLPLIERELGAFDYRPHWGKLFKMDPAQLRSRYERLPDFLSLAKKFDPNGKFRNDFLNRNVFGS